MPIETVFFFENCKLLNCESIEVMGVSFIFLQENHIQDTQSTVPKWDTPM